MTTGEGPNPREGQTKPDAEAPRRGGDRIGVGGGDDSVSRIQLAARWAEAYTTEGESLAAILRRFRVGYEYLDAVIHGVEPPDFDSTAEQAKPAVPPPGADVAPPAWGTPEPAPPPAAPPAPPSPPPWSNP
jgi:hypothetical protein